MRFHAYHGVLPQERLVGNDYEVTVVMDVDISKAALSDNVADTVNYAEVYEVIQKVMSEPRHLLERVAWLISEALLNCFSTLDAVEVCITKLNPPMGADCEGAEVKIKATR